MFLIGEGRTNELCGHIQIPVQIIKFEPELKSFELIIIPKMPQFKLEGEWIMNVQIVIIFCGGNTQIYIWEVIRDGCPNSKTNVCFLISRGQ